MPGRRRRNQRTIPGAFTKSAVSTNCISSKTPPEAEPLNVHAGSSGGLGHSPTNQEIVGWETIGGSSVQGGQYLRRSQAEAHITPDPYGYVFFETRYDALNDYRNSTSHHPLTLMSALIARYPFAVAARLPLLFRSNPRPAVSQSVQVHA